MKNIINIQGNNQVFPYLIEYSKGNTSQDGMCVNWCIDRNVIRLLDNDIQYYRYGNEWFNVSSLVIPEYFFSISLSSEPEFTPTVDNNWKLKTLAPGTKVTFDSNSKATTFLENYPAITASTEIGENLTQYVYDLGMEQ